MHINHIAERCKPEDYDFKIKFLESERYVFKIRLAAYSNP